MLEVILLLYSCLKTVSNPKWLSHFTVLDLMMVLSLERDTEEQTRISERQSGVSSYLQSFTKRLSEKHRYTYM